MNRHLHKVIFSKRTGTLVVVAENARSISKGNSSGGSAMSRSGAMRMTMFAMMLNLGASAAWALNPGALPTGANVRHGNVTQSVSGNTMTIQQTTAKAVVNYESFNIGSNAKVNHSGGVMLSRVTGSGSTQINGTLNTSGMVLVNPNGIAIGSTGNINAGSFTASTYNITDENFLNGNNRFERNGSTGTVVNEGTIKITEGGGYVALFGAQVDNRGRIETQGGAAVLASGQNATIKVPLSGKVSLELDAAEINASVTNHEQGVVVTKGGQVMMRAAAVVDVASGVANAQVKQAGLIDTTAAKGGRVDVLADRGTIKVTGKIKANSTGTDSQGKPVAGGDVFIGRDDKTNQLAQHTDVSQAKIESVGGFVETSAHQMNIDGIQVKADQWLIDPYDIEITDSATLTAGYTTKISASTISATLSEGTSVNIRTSPENTPTTTGIPTSLNPSLGTFDGTGNILVSSAITQTSAPQVTTQATLALFADNNLTIAAPLTLIGRGNFYAKGDVNFEANSSSDYGFSIDAHRNININASVFTGNTSTFNAGALSPEPWRTQVGSINFGTNGKVTFTTYLQLNSGKLTTDHTKRSSISASNLVQDAKFVGKEGLLHLKGFDNVTLPTLSYKLDTDLLSEVQVIAKNIHLDGDLSAKNISLQAAAFDNVTSDYHTNTNPLNGTPTGWTSQNGGLNQGNFSINYSNNLLLYSGLEAGNGGVRKNYTLTQQSNTTFGDTDLFGFNNVTIGEVNQTTSLNGRKIRVIASNIHVNQHLNMSDEMTFMAASFDPTHDYAKGSIAGTAGNTSATPGKNGYAGTPTAVGGWRNLGGLITIDDGAKLTSKNYNLYSGVDPTNIQKRDDINLHDKLAAPSQGGVSRINFAGFNTVTLPLDINSLTGEAIYSVVAQNIVGGALNFINANSLRLDAGRFKLTDGVNAFPLSKQGVPNNDVYWSEGKEFGTVLLQNGFTLQANSVSLTSGKKTDGTREDLFLGAMRPFNVTSIDAVQPYSVARGAYSYSFQGFNTVDLPKHVIKSELFDIKANTINVYDDINAGGGNWWPHPFYLSLEANAYSNGKVNFIHPTDRKITLRSSSILSAGTYTPANQDRGFNSRLAVISNGGDFDVLLGYKQENYSAGGAGEYSSLRIEGFERTDLNLEPAASGNTTPRDITIAKAWGGPYSNELRIIQKEGATGWISIHNNLKSQGGTTLWAQNGGIRMGDRVVTTPSINIRVGKDSALNTDTTDINFHTIGGTLVINEANNLNISGTGNVSDAGSIEINTRGELILSANLSRTNPNSSVTLSSDATLGRQIKVDAETFATADLNLNTTFEKNNKNIFGETGGDGLGAVRVDPGISQQLVVPIFRKIATVESTDGFVVPQNGIYFRADGTPIAKDTKLATGTILLVDRSTKLSSALDSVTDTGQPIRLAAVVDQGGYTIKKDEVNRYYNKDGVAYTTGTNLNANQTVYYKPEVGLAAALTGIDTPDVPQQLYVVQSYLLGSNSSVTEYTSLGTDKNNLTAFNYASTSATLVTGDVPVDVSKVENYYGNPLSNVNGTGTNNLNMSGQFYTLNNSKSIAVPTMFNMLADNGEQDSKSKNGWDKSWGTSSLSTSGGNLSVFSGPNYALSGTGFNQGDAADLTIFTNPTVTDFSKDKPTKVGAFNLRSGSGDLVVLGFRDVVVEPEGILNSTGNVTIGAARDLIFKEDVRLGGNNKLTTLIAGGMLSTKKNDGNYNTIKGDRVLIAAGGGVDVQTEVNLLAGSLQNNPAIEGGLAATGTFKVNAKNDLRIGSITNNNVRDLTFGTNTGIQYIADSKLTRHGIWSTNASDKYGKIELTAPNIIQQASIAAGSGSQKAAVNVTATSGSITRIAPAANSPVTEIVGSDVSLKAASTIGAAGSFIHTEANTLSLDSAGSQYIEEQSDVILAAKTTNASTTVQAVGDLTVGQAGNLTGVNTVSGNVILAAGFKRDKGDGTGGQIKVAGNPYPPLISTTGQIRLFTGNTTDTGKLEQLDASMNNLYLWAMGDNRVNAQTYTAYEASTSITNGANAQVMFREKIALTPTLNGLTYTYGEVDRSFNVYEAIKAKNTGNMNQNTGAGNFIYESAKFFAETQGAAIEGDTWSSSDLLNANTKGYGVNLQGSSGSNFDLSKSSALMTVSPKTLKVEYKAENKVYDGETTAKVAPFTTDILIKDVVTFEQTSAFVSPEVGNNKDVNVTGITLLGTDASNYTLVNPTYLTRANIVAEGTDPDASESGSSGSGSGGSGTGGSGTSGSGTNGSGTNGSSTSGSGTGSGTSTAETNTTATATRPDTNNLIEPKGTKDSGSNASNVSVQVAEFEFKLSSADEENACSIDNLENCVCEAPEDENGAPMEWMEICYPEDEIKKKA